MYEPEDFLRLDAGLQFGVVDTVEFQSLIQNGLIPTHRG